MFQRIQFNEFLMFVITGCMRARALVDSDYFMYAIFICILLNTMSMAVEFHQQVSIISKAIRLHVGIANSFTDI